MKMSSSEEEVSFGPDIRPPQSEKRKDNRRERYDYERDRHKHSRISKKDRREEDYHKRRHHHRERHVQDDYTRDVNRSYRTRDPRDSREDVYGNRKAAHYEQSRSSSKSYKKHSPHLDRSSNGTVEMDKEKDRRRTALKQQELEEHRRRTKIAEEEGEKALRAMEMKQYKERRNKTKESSPSSSPPTPKAIDSDFELEKDISDEKKAESLLEVAEIEHSPPELNLESPNEGSTSEISEGEEDDGKSVDSSSSSSSSHESVSSVSSEDSTKSEPISNGKRRRSIERDEMEASNSGKKPRRDFAEDASKVIAGKDSDPKPSTGSESSSDPKLKEHNTEQEDVRDEEKDLLPAYYPAIQGCRRVEEFQLLNRIEEGTYGVVYRATDKRTKEIVALKRLKMEKEKDGFPITSLREINTLLKAQHENIVTVREIVVGSNTDRIFLVMDYVEHDLKSLMETLKKKEQIFILGEVKCLMIQLLRAVAHLHDNWILHRDLKTSNLLLSHKGILKVGDFGLAREYGSPLKQYTSIVVTLWYRAPELLLGVKEYSTQIDIWSVGCIFGELLKMTPMFPGKNEANQLNLIFSTLGTPNEKIWPGYNSLPMLQKMTFAEYPVNKLKVKYEMLTELGIDLLNKLLTYNPNKRITAEEALNHKFWEETPLPIDPSLFPTWPAKSEMGQRKAAASPRPPSGGRQFREMNEEDSAGFFMENMERKGAGFSLKF